MTLIIKKDPYINEYIVWEKHRNYHIELFRGYKYECVEWLKRKGKR